MNTVGSTRPVLRVLASTLKSGDDCPFLSEPHWSSITAATGKSKLRLCDVRFKQISSFSQIEISYDVKKKKVERIDTLTDNAKVKQEGVGEDVSGTQHNQGVEIQSAPSISNATLQNSSVHEILNSMTPETIQPTDVPLEPEETGVPATQTSVVSQDKLPEENVNNDDDNGNDPIDCLDASVNRVKNLDFNVLNPTSTPSISSFDPSSLLCINLSANLLSTIEGIQACKNLIYLDVSDNIISSVHPIADLYALRRLKVSNNRLNQLSFIPETGLVTEEMISSKSLPSLKFIDASHNMLSTLEGVITYSSIISHLDIRDCGLQVSCLSALERLPIETLLIDNNKIDDISIALETFKTFGSLRHLSCLGNSFQTNATYMVQVLDAISTLDTLDHVPVSKELYSQLELFKMQLVGDAFVRKLEQSYQRDIEEMQICEKNLLRRHQFEETLFRKVKEDHSRRREDALISCVKFAESKVAAATHLIRDNNAEFKEFPSPSHVLPQIAKTPQEEVQMHVMRQKKEALYIQGLSESIDRMTRQALRGNKKWSHEIGKGDPRDYAYHDDHTTILQEVGAIGRMFPWNNIQSDKTNIFQPITITVGGGAAGKEDIGNVISHLMQQQQQQQQQLAFPPSQEGPKLSPRMLKSSQNWLSKAKEKTQTKTTTSIDSTRSVTQPVAVVPSRQGSFRSTTQADVKMGTISPRVQESSKLWLQKAKEKATAKAMEEQRKRDMEAGGGVSTQDMQENSSGRSISPRMMTSSQVWLKKAKEKARAKSIAEGTKSHEISFNARSKSISIGENSLPSGNASNIPVGEVAPLQVPASTSESVPITVTETVASTSITMASEKSEDSSSSKSIPKSLPTVHPLAALGQSNLVKKSSRYAQSPITAPALDTVPAIVSLSTAALVNKSPRSMSVGQNMVAGNAAGGASEPTLTRNASQLGPGVVSPPASPRANLKRGGSVTGIRPELAQANFPVLSKAPSVRRAKINF